MLPGKASMSTISIIAHSGSTAVVYVVEGEPLVFEVESVLYPTGESSTLPFELVVVLEHNVVG